MKPQVFQRDDKVYIVAPVSEYKPGDQQIEALAFADQLRTEAPNDNIMWLKGAYVEAERENANGHIWTSDEIGLKHLTPRLMPVTVMHDPATAVGLIADAKLLTPEESGVERARIDTTLAVWKHRFPEIAEECGINFEQGTLMQSMECHPGYYECGTCHTTAPNVPGKLYEAGLCEHVTASEGLLRGRRILGNVTFTGTGLIFGTRGARGAYDEANLDVFREEVAQFHTSGTPSKSKRTSRSRSRMDTTEIKVDEYAELKARPTADALAAAETRAEEAETAKAKAEAEKAEAEKRADDAEVAQKAAEDERDTLKEKAEQTALADERMGKVGSALLAKLPDSVKANLNEQAKSLSDEAWASRIEELSSLTGVEADAKADESDENDGEVTRDEVAGTNLGGGGAKPPSTERRASTVGGLMKTVA